MKNSPNLEFDIDIKETEEWFNKNQLEIIVDRCQEVLGFDPNCAFAYKIIGNICTLKGELEKAVEWYEKSLKLQPERPEVYVNLGSIFARKKQSKLAGAYYQKAINLDPNLFIAHLNLSKIWQLLGKDRDATDCLYRASELQPDRFEAEEHLNLGNQLLEQQQLTRAIACYHRALQIDPNLFAAYQNLAEAFARQGNSDEANRYSHWAAQLGSTQTPLQKASNKALDSQRESEEVPKEKGLDSAIERETGQRETADTTLRHSPQNSQSQSTARDLEESGDACVARGELDGAVLAYRQALELAPDAWQLYHKLGDVLQARGQLYEALEVYDRATAIVADDSPEQFPDKPPSE